MSSAVTRSFNSISFGSLSITQYQCLPMASRLRSACVYEKGFSDCGRDVHYWTPPAQIRTCGFPAYGSHLGCLTAKRSLSDLPYVAQRLGHAFPVLCPARAVLPRIPLGPRPSLPRLRSRSPGLVRRLRRYYGGV